MLKDEPVVSTNIVIYEQKKSINRKKIKNYKPKNVVAI